MLVAVTEDQLVGFASFGKSRDADATSEVGELCGLYVHLDSNQRGRALYHRRGWCPDGAQQREERPGVVLAEVRYRRALDVGHVR